MFKKLAVIALLAAISTATYAADATSSAQQTSTSQSVAQGSITFSQTPADQHLTETVHNVSAPILGSYAFAASQLSCGSTTQGGFAVAGFSGVFGSSKDSESCVLEVAAAETVRQSTVDPIRKEALQVAAINIRCQVSWQIYYALTDAGFNCPRKPSGIEPK